MQISGPKTYLKLEQEVKFLNRIINSLPATVHIIELDDDFNTFPIWTNKKYEKILGCSLEERKKIGYAGNDDAIYHPDDIQSIKDSIRYLLEHKDEYGSIFFRIKKGARQYAWLHMLATVFKRNKKHTQLLCMGIDINNKLAFNQSKIDLYLKEISQLRYKLRLSVLTNTEKKIAQLYGSGLSTKEIASKLNRSYDTVNNHKRHVFTKLGFHKVTELVHFAEECGLV